MKFIKKLSITLAVIAIILVGGVFIAMSFIDKSLVESQVSKALGRELKINGEISPQLSLSPTIKITDAVLANADWGSKAPLAKIGEVEVSLELIPLLSSDVQINSLTLKNSDISIEKKKGKWNFEFGEEKTKEEIAAEAAEEPSENNFSIGNINIENLNLSVKDGKTATYKISELKLDPTSELDDFALKANLDGTNISLTTQITPILELAETQKASLKNFKLSALDYNLSGNLAADLSKQKPYISGNINVGNIDLSKAESEDAKATGAAEETKELYSKAPLPFDLLNALNADIKIALSSLKLNDKIEMQNVNLPIKISGGVLTANKLKLPISDSLVNADIKLSKESSTISLNAKDFKASEIVLGSDFSGGLTDIDANLKASGDSVHALVNSLSGNSKIHLKDAVYSGEVKDGLLKKLVKLLAGGTTSAQTEISCVITEIDWDKGVGEVKDLGIVSDNAVVTGKGKVKLGSQKIKLVLVPKAKNIGLTDFLVPPIAVSGNFNDISVYPEAKGTAVSAIKTAAGIASGVGIFATLGEMVADKTGLTEAVGLATANPCSAFKAKEEIPQQQETNN